MPAALRDSRRWPGPSLLLDAPGAVIDASVDDAERGDLVKAWRAALTTLLDLVGWPAEQIESRTFDGGVTLAFTAPIDALYAATEVNELAFEAACAYLAHGHDVDHESERIDALRKTIHDERNPALLELRDAAAEHDVAFLSDDDHASIGLGTGARTWTVDALPPPEEVDWSQAHDVPTVMVTGTNGKSTTVRLLAHIAKAAGKVPGFSTTDWIRVGDKTLDTGDYSGPGGARSVLRDPHSEIAILETARGGLLRRGLGYWRADAAAILNVAEDHLGEWGVGDLAALVEGKFILRKAVRPGGALVLNADDPPVRARGQQVDGNCLWFSLDANDALLGEDAAFVRDGVLVLRRSGVETKVIPEADIAFTFGGRARFNTSNALAACALASCAGLSIEAMREGLATFESSPAENPGRMNHFEIGGATVFADFAHNPHGFRALFDMAAGFEGRSLVLLGQAGDRTDADVRALVEATWTARPDRIVVKDMPQHLRGREPGAMVALIDSELQRAGVPSDRIDHAPSELDAVRQALAWSQPGDLLLLLLHAQRTEVLELLQWQTAQHA